VGDAGGPSIGTPDAFRDPTSMVIADRSLYRALPGVLCVQGLLARAQGDDTTQQAATNRFVAAAEPPSDHMDVALGTAGLLLGASMLLEALPPTLEDHGVRALGDTLRERLCGHLGDAAGINGQPADWVGIAHGLTGIIYALLHWSDASSTAPAPGLERGLDHLAALAEPEGRGLCWPTGSGRAAPEHPLSASWCNGTAGFVHLWTAAHRRYGDEAFDRLAERCAWHAYHAPTSDGSLCCGLSGRAYALRCLYKHTGDKSWLLRARELADRAAASMRGTVEPRDSLYDGAVGVAVLATDLHAPQDACMPLFESEGWPPRS
jgi:eukaryotic-like serine/threonine-protein kinase